MAERSKNAAGGMADGWESLCAADAASIIDDDDADIIDGWLATTSAREFEAILGYLLG